MDDALIERRCRRGHRMLLIGALVVACASPPPGAGQEAAPPRTASDAERPGPTAPEDPVEPIALTLDVVARYPHDTKGFTQGLLWHDGHLYESTGLYGHSEIKRVDLESGTTLSRRPLDRSLFGEGLARVDDRLVQLTWMAGVATVFDLETLEPVAEWSYNGQGWGLAYDDVGKRLIRSDGTERLTFHDPETFAERGGVDVTVGGRPLPNLNELEVVDGQVWANVWQQQRLVRIDPERGVVTAIVDARGLLGADERRGTDVLNGIAYNADSELFYLTGKLWPALFAVRFVASD